MHVETIAFYDHNADALAAQYDAADMSSMYRLISRLLPADGRILEIGCGNGRDARKLSEMGFSVTACDASCEMIEIARAAKRLERVKYHCKAFPVQSGDSILSCRFDLVLSVAMIMHLPLAQIPDFIEQISAMLVANGIFIFSWCNRESCDERLYEKVTREYIFSLLRGNSLEIIDCATTKDSLGRAIDWFQVVARKRSETLKDRLA